MRCDAMETIRGTAQEVRIESVSITISDSARNGKSVSIRLDEIVAVRANGNNVEIESNSGFSSTRTSVEFSSYSDASNACRKIYAATPMAKEIRIDGNVLWIGSPYGFNGKSIRMDEIKSAQADNGVLKIHGKFSYNSIYIRRKNPSDAKREADMINGWLREREEQPHEAKPTYAAAWHQTSGAKQQEMWKSEQYVQPRPRKRRKGTLKTVGLILLALAVISFLQGLKNGTRSGLKGGNKDYYYTDSLGNQYSYNIAYTGDEPTVYSRTPNELIDEWKSNVAKAEETYQKENTYIATDGYIDSINKNESDNSYYIILTESPDEWNLFGSNEIRVHFHNEREYRALLDYSTGDHIAILCYSSDTTFFMEYPELEVLLVLDKTVAKPFNRNGNRGSTTDDTALPTAMIDYIGLTVADVERWYGADYAVDSLDGGGYWMFYSSNPGRPYAFLFCPAQGYDYDDTSPKADDIIYGVCCDEAGVAVIGDAAVGMKHNDFAIALGQPYTAETDVTSEYDLPSAFFDFRTKNAHDTKETDYWLNLLEDDGKVVYAKLFKKIN